MLANQKYDMASLLSSSGITMVGSLLINKISN